MKSAQRLALIVIVAASCAAGVAAPMAQTATPALARLRASRNEIALSLSRPISRCIQRHDTDAPAFHGCIDWHSAVHATWALIAYGNLTHDDRYAPLVQSILTDQNIRLEMQSIKANPAFEMPYGRSWFLRLAIEYGAAYHDGRLIPMGDLVADTLLDRYQRQPPQVYSDAYQSDSWAMINLIDYFRYRGDRHKLAIVAQMVRHDFMGADSVACDPSLERPEFMAICTNVAWAVSMTADRPEFNAWIVKFLPVSAVAAPILAPATAHENGLNFSRAWGLWAIYAATGKVGYLRAYVADVQTAYGARDSWDGPYETVAHWVPQFGMLATRPLFGDEGAASARSEAP